MPVNADCINLPDALDSRDAVDRKSEWEKEGWKLVEKEISHILKGIERKREVAYYSTAWRIAHSSTSVQVNIKVILEFEDPFAVKPTLTTFADQWLSPKSIDNLLTYWPSDRWSY